MPTIVGDDMPGIIDILQRLVNDDKKQHAPGWPDPKWINENGIRELTGDPGVLAATCVW